MPYPGQLSQREPLGHNWLKYRIQVVYPLKRTTETNLNLQLSTILQTELRKNESFQAFTKTIEKENSQNNFFLDKISLSVVVI